MAEELQFSSLSGNKPNLDDSSVSRRSTGFSPQVAPPSPDAEKTPSPSYNSVDPLIDMIQISKMTSEELLEKLFINVDLKRPKAESLSDFSAHPTDFHRPVGHQMPSLVGMAPPATYQQHGYSGSSKKIEIPNTMDGVISGKHGEIIKDLQAQIGAKIQITKDMEENWYSKARMVLAKDEAEGSARSTGGVQVGGTHFTMTVPNDRVGMVIGKGGETIKSMQENSGARSQIDQVDKPSNSTQIFDPKQELDEIVHNFEKKIPSLYEKFRIRKCTNSQLQENQQQSTTQIPMHQMSPHFASGQDNTTATATDVTSFVGSDGSQPPKKRSLRDPLDLSVKEIETLIAEEGLGTDINDFVSLISFFQRIYGTAPAPGNGSRSDDDEGLRAEVPFAPCTFELLPFESTMPFPQDEVVYW